MIEAANAAVLLLPTGLVAAYVGYKQRFGSVLIAIGISLLNLLVAFTATSNVPDPPDIPSAMVFGAFMAQIGIGVAIGIILRAKKMRSAHA